MKTIVFTDQYDLCQKIRQLFLCCLYWRTGHKDFVRMSRWTTMDHVLHLLDHMDVLKKSIIEKAFKKEYWKNPYLQGTFRTILTVKSGGTGNFSEIALNESRALLLGVARKSEQGSEISRALRNMQIYITLSGVLRATEYEKILEPFVTSREYLPVLDQYRAEFEQKREAARAAIIREAAARVEKELAEQDEEA